LSLPFFLFLCQFPFFSTTFVLHVLSPFFFHPAGVSISCPPFTPFLSRRSGPFQLSPFSSTAMLPKSPSTFVFSVRRVEFPDNFPPFLSPIVRRIRFPGPILLSGALSPPSAYWAFGPVLPFPLDAPQSLPLVFSRALFPWLHLSLFLSGSSDSPSAP